LLIEKLIAEAAGEVFNQQSAIKNQQLLQACEEAEHQPLPPAAIKRKQKGERHA